MIGGWRAKFPLRVLLQGGFEIQFRLPLNNFSNLFDNVLDDKSSRWIDSPVQVDGRNNRLECIRHDRRRFAARNRHPFSGQQEIVQPKLHPDFATGRATDGGRLDLRQIAFQ